MSHGEPELSSDAERVRAELLENRASFFSDLVRLTGLLRTQVEAALGELVANGLVTSDSFAGLRALITPSAKRASFSRPRRRTDRIGMSFGLTCVAPMVIMVSS